METKRISGSALKEGDVMRVWWTGGYDVVTGFRPWVSPLADLFPAGARIVQFARCPGGMTVGNDDLIEVVPNPPRR